MKCSVSQAPEGFVCSTHGSAWTADGCLMGQVLHDVAEHREWQFSNYGANRDVPDGTGKDVQWLAPIQNEAVKRFANGGERDIIAFEIENLFRKEWDYDNSATEKEKEQFRKDASWMRMVREEVAEAFAEDDPERLYAEVTQFVALGVSWMEKIRERQIWQYGVRYSDGVFSFPYWYSPADVMREQHGQAPRGTAVQVVRRRLGGEWEDMP